jgi:hypothetical protein
VAAGNVPSCTQGGHSHAKTGGMQNARRVRAPLAVGDRRMAAACPGGARARRAARSAATRGASVVAACRRGTVTVALHCRARRAAIRSTTFQPAARPCEGPRPRREIDDHRRVVRCAAMPSGRPRERRRSRARQHVVGMDARSERRTSETASKRHYGHDAVAQAAAVGVHRRPRAAHDAADRRAAHNDDPRRILRRVDRITRSRIFGGAAAELYGLDSAPDRTTVRAPGHRSAEQNAARSTGVEHAFDCVGRPCDLGLDAEVVQALVRGQQ